MTSRRGFLMGTAAIAAAGLPRFTRGEEVAGAAQFKTVLKKEAEGTITDTTDKNTPLLKDH